MVDSKSIDWSFYKDDFLMYQDGRVEYMDDPKPDRSHHFVKPSLQWEGDEERTGVTFMCFRLEVEIEPDGDFDWAIYDANGRLITEAAEFEDSLVGAQLAAEAELSCRLDKVARTLDDACLRLPPLPAPYPIVLASFPSYIIPEINWQPVIDAVYGFSCPVLEENGKALNYSGSVAADTVLAKGPSVPSLIELYGALTPLGGNAEAARAVLDGPAVDLGNPHYEEKEPSGYDQILAQIKREAEEVKL